MALAVSPWTPDAILVSVHAWVQAHQGHFPSQAALSAAAHLPSKHVIHHHFRTMVALKHAYEQRYGSRAGIVVCPRCGERWWSPDKYDTHQHPYALRRVGQCRLAGQERYQARRKRRIQPPSSTQGIPPLREDVYQQLVRSLLDEALGLRRGTP